MSDTPTVVQIARAVAANRAEIVAMQALSMRKLASPFYDSEVIEAHIAMGTLDDALIADGTYYIALIDGVIVGTGGWSTRVPGYAAQLADADVTAPSPKPTVRAVYVHPQAARRGVARAIMQRVEAEIADAGYATAGLIATLSGIPLYRRLGWRSGAPTMIALPGRLNLIGLHMSKPLTSPSGRVAAAA